MKSGPQVRAKKRDDTCFDLSDELGVGLSLMQFVPRRLANQKRSARLICGTPERTSVIWIVVAIPCQVIFNSYVLIQIWKLQDRKR